MNTSRTKRKWTHAAAVIMVVALTACGGDGPGNKGGFFTSGDREADQRAQQRMAKDQQIQAATDGDAAAAPAQQTLYQRVGGESGIRAIVDDFIIRAMADPRVNWQRKDVTTGGLGPFGGSDAEWDATPANVERLKRHMAQFLAVATGGPAEYGGRDMRAVHKGMRVTNAEFDATIGCFKATLDKLQIPDREQQELIAVLESTRTQVAEER